MYLTRVVTWNLRRANKNREDVWGYFQSLDPDIALLQEVGSLPDSIASEYSILQRKAYAGDGRKQKFSTCIMVKGEVKREITFTTSWDWDNDELRNFAGNIIPVEVSLNSGEKYNTVSVYSLAWPVFGRERHKEIDVSSKSL